jgi:hypothetical protein
MFTADPELRDQQEIVHRRVVPIDYPHHIRPLTASLAVRILHLQPAADSLSISRFASTRLSAQRSRVQLLHRRIQRLDGKLRAQGLERRLQQTRQHQLPLSIPPEVTDATVHSRKQVTTSQPNSCGMS